MINGPESFTPDFHAILGEAPGVSQQIVYAYSFRVTFLCAMPFYFDNGLILQVRNYFVAAGMNTSGIASAGGFGRALAEWIADGM